MKLCAADVRARCGRAIVVRLFWNTLPPCLLERGAQHSDGTAHRAAVIPGPERAQDTPSGREVTRFHGEALETRARVPGRGQRGTATTGAAGAQAGPNGAGHGQGGQQGNSDEDDDTDVDLEEQWGVPGPVDPNWA